MIDKVWSAPACAGGCFLRDFQFFKYANQAQMNSDLGWNPLVGPSAEAKKRPSLAFDQTINLTFHSVILFRILVFSAY